MRPVRTILTVAFVAAVAVTSCSAHSTGQPSAAPAAPVTVAPAPPVTVASPRQPAPKPPTSPAPKPTPDPGSEIIIGLWPVKTLAQARELQDSVDAGHQPWLLSAESISIAYAQGELGLFAPYAERVGPAAYQVRSHHGEWEATLYLAQPVRHDNGVWIVTRVGDPVS